MLRELRRGEDILELHGAEARRWRSGGDRDVVDVHRSDCRSGLFLSSFGVGSLEPPLLLSENGLLRTTS